MSILATSAGPLISTFWTRNLAGTQGGWWAGNPEHDRVASKGDL